MTARRQWQAKRSRYKVLTNKYSVYFFYVMKKLYHAVALDTQCIMLSRRGIAVIFCLIGRNPIIECVKQSMLLQVSVPFPHRISVEGMFHPPSIVVTTQLHAYWGTTLHHRLPRHLQTPYVCEESSSPFYVSSCPVHATRSELEQGQISYVNDQEHIQIQTQ